MEKAEASLLYKEEEDQEMYSEKQGYRKKQASEV